MLVLHLLKQRFFLKWQIHFFHPQDNVHQEPIVNNQNFVCLFLFQIKIMSSEWVASLSHNLKVTSLLRVSFFTSDKNIALCVLEFDKIEVFLAHQECCCYLTGNNSESTVTSQLHYPDLCCGSSTLLASNFASLVQMSL